MKSSNFRYLVGVDHLRGIAALAVLLYHSTQLITGDLKGHYFDPHTDRGITAWNPVKAVVSEGQLGVSLFMVLSGFIFVSGLLGRRWSVPQFFYNRFVRIYPLYVFLIVLAVGLYPQTSTGALLQALVPIAGFSPTDTYAGTVNSTGVIWTVVVEVQFYLLFPFLMRWVEQRRFWLLGRIVLLMIILRLLAMVAGDVDMGRIGYTIWGHLDEFICGMVAAWLFRNRSDVVHRWRWALLVGGLVGWAALALGMNRWRVHVGEDAYSDIFVILPTITGIVMAVVVLGWVTTVTSERSVWSRLLARLGLISYSLYLTHFMVLRILVAQVDLPRLGFSPWLDSLVWSVVVFLPLTIALSALTYSVVEKPFLELRKRYVTTPEEARVTA
jgi:peptidoglycan/LPS O-acetylase OafA/YrhL